MAILSIYTLLAILLLLLSTGYYQPKGWRQLTEKHVTLLRTGSFLGFVIITVKLASKLID